MKNMSAFYTVGGIIGKCGDQAVFLGLLPAKILHSTSFADIMDEETGRGYQRPRNRRHSLGFKKFIITPGATTIPLTFNLRRENSEHWIIKKHSGGTATLHISKSNKCMAQVDCQHRLGELQDSTIPLAFMTFIGLSLREEMAIFNVINSKAKGLSSSLTDYHESKLVDSLKTDAPHLYIARRLNEDLGSPWYGLVRYGGENTSGLKRRTSLRMMQKAVLKLLKHSKSSLPDDADEIYQVIADYWAAVAMVFPKEWGDHRHHLISKGVGLYALMGVLGEIANRSLLDDLRTDCFASLLQTFVASIDWGTGGTFSGTGGRKGAKEAQAKLCGILEL
jgi:DGQHR domain-containing protein